AYLKLSEIALLLKDYANSIKYANDALKIDVFNPTAYFLKGMTYKYGKDTNNAISSFQTAIEQDNQYYKAFVELGFL
ncbi:tetratricopeptide repeat protein, partial [Propionibacterium freudenreichii]|uniref:tetratricopeptide repeat protein n=1 Tax=Propionibacterium freudenreichii TaxID=1744 RepID=UPI0038520002